MDQSSDAKHKKSTLAADAKRKGGQRDEKEQRNEKETKSSSATRETVESIVVAVILAFLFRTFIAEAFVIPTGSMAPTLQGVHKDVVCAQCDFQYRAGASGENDNGGFERRMVVGTICPICRYQMRLDLYGDPDHRSASGDRILVSKFSYSFVDPERWDVIVFKYPANAAQNFIKRLVGLPHETVQIHRGNIYVRTNDDDPFRIARKPPDKVKAMLQLVDDTHYIAPDLRAAGWPSRWQPWAPQNRDVTGAWQFSDDLKRVATDGSARGPVWLRYRHIIPSLRDWELVEGGYQFTAADDIQPQLINDFYEYNAYATVSPHRVHRDIYDPQAPLHDVRIGSAQSDPWGSHWVSDLAIEADVQVEDDSGDLLLTLVASGVHYRCRIQVHDGTATLTIPGQQTQFVAEAGEEAGPPLYEVSGSTRLSGPGSYHIRFANVDNQLTLWINERVVTFDGPTTYQAPSETRPVWSPQDPGDLAPLGIGSDGLAMQVERLRVLRDVYYVASEGGNDYMSYWSGEEIRDIMRQPQRWDSTALWDDRRSLEFEMGADEFYTLGDNSPQSKDARMWQPEPHVHRDMLTGKALLIYWPQALRRPIPFFPNFQRMGLIR